MIGGAESRLRRAHRQETPREHHPGAYLHAFWNRAYRENVTGLAAMVAYNLMLAVFPFVLLVLFVFGQIVKSDAAASSVLIDLQRLFPNVEQGTLTHALDTVRDSATTIGIVAVVGGLWIGASFWGAMDTAFCRIYHVDCRGWVEQKRFSLLMLFVVMLFLAASVVIPAAEGALISSTEDLPLGLSGISILPNLLVVLAALGLSFLVSCVIYWAVPKGHMPWADVWPGAAFVTLTTGLANWAFPFYLTNVSTASRFGSTIGFVLIALVWFYAIAIALLAGAVINSLRHELAATGKLPYSEPAAEAPAPPVT
ncbi:MAG: rane protein [Solirubrobacterales bacterium]|nr:rane protein [Solirubrobacterales bacterium]